MSDQVKPPSVFSAQPGPDVFFPPVRTLADVQADLALAGFELNRHRSRRGDTVNQQERLAQRPALLVHEVNCLLDEWSALSR